MIFKRYRIYFKQFDWILLAAVFLLVCFSLAALYSLALRSEEPNFLNFKKQIFFAIGGFVLMFLVSRFDASLLKVYSRPLYILACFILLAVLVLGQSIRGTRGWFLFGDFAFQPVELVKICLIIFLARYFSDWARHMDQIRHIIKSALGTAFLIFLVICQPDFGSSVLLLILWLAMVLAIGLKRRHLFIIFSVLILLTAIAWFFIFKDYQKDRVMTFLDPSRDPLGRGYSISQSIIAVGSGRGLGRGLGFGSQSQLNFLPEAQTDFIFAVIAEELGFIGAVFILAFFGVLFYRMTRAARRTNNDFNLFLILGIALLFFIQVFINVGMNIGLMPVTGISLPLVSYGGSSLVSTLLMVGLIESIIIRTKAGSI